MHTIGTIRHSNCKVHLTKTEVVMASRNNRPSQQELMDKYRRLMEEPNQQSIEEKHELEEPEKTLGERRKQGSAELPVEVKISNEHSTGWMIKM